jgi:hypothetical protein
VPGSHRCLPRCFEKHILRVAVAKPFFIWFNGEFSLADGMNCSPLGPTREENEELVVHKLFKFPQAATNFLAFSASINPPS